MNVEALITLARNKVSGRVPSYIDMNRAAAMATEDVADMAVQRVSAAMEQAILGAQSILKTTCEKYIEALYVTDDLTIGIREDAKYLEDGYSESERLDKMLDSSKAKISKDGDRYLVVPMGDKPDTNVAAAISMKASELFTKGRQSKASGRTLTNMMKEMQEVARKSTNKQPSSFQNKEFRTATDKQDQSKDWVHPGFRGVNQLEFINQQLRVDLEEGAVRMLENAIDELRR